MTYNFSEFIKCINVSHISDGDVTFNGYTSMYNALSEVGESFTDMPFCQRMLLVAEILNTLQISAEPPLSEIISEGRIFICTLQETDTGEYRIIVTDTTDFSIVLDEYFERLQTAEIMNDIHDLKGLRKWLENIGEVLSIDEMVLTNDPNMSDQTSEFDDDGLET